MLLVPLLNALNIKLKVVNAHDWASKQQKGTKKLPHFLWEVLYDKKISLPFKSMTCLKGRGQNLNAKGERDDQGNVVL